MESATFLGHSADYWMDLERRFLEVQENPRCGELLEEIVKLRGKISFYESRIAEMASRMAP